MNHADNDSRTALPELAFVFLRLGLIAFGGPAAHIALMEDEFVRRKGWLTKEKLLAIFLPAFIFKALSGPLVPRLRESPAAGAFLDGVVAASLALMAVVTWQLGRAALLDWFTILLTLVSLILLFRYRVNSAWLVLAGASLGLILIATT